MRKETNENNQLAASTAACYSKRARQLWSKWLRESWPNVDASDPSGFIRWLKERKHGWKAATWRQNKAAVIFSFIYERGGFWPMTCESELGYALLTLSNETQLGTHSVSGRTSSTKARRIKPKEFTALKRHFSASRSKYARILESYFTIGTSCGLRPIEWVGARLNVPPGGQIVLRVRNAKSTYGRSHGPFRTLTWANPPIGFKNALLEWFMLIESVSGRDEMARSQWEAVLEGMRDELARACRKIWPKRKRHITLYSVRHEAAAVWKLYFRPEEVAALMGHATDETAYRHYGKILASRGGVSLSQNSHLPMPCLEEVERVWRTGWQQKQAANHCVRGGGHSQLVI